jgi:hypothetical protein
LGNAGKQIKDRPRQISQRLFQAAWAKEEVLVTEWESGMEVVAVAVEDMVVVAVKGRDR